VSGLPTTPGANGTSTPDVRVQQDGSVALTERSDGATVHVHVGTVLHVVLDNDFPPFQWSALSVSGQALRVLDATPGDQDTVSADIRAIAAGTATLSASNNPHCEPPCGAASQLWRVTVVVQ
jgi:hypothetical protein